jgi:hypothetical protein
MLTREDVEDLKNEFDERYVQQKSCNDIQLQNNSRFSNDDKRIEIMVHDFGIIKKLMWAVATASIGSLVVAFFELIIK